MKPIDVRCDACGTLFGKTNGEQLYVKHRDLYRIVQGGTVEGPCRNCGAMVKWTAKDETTK